MKKICFIGGILLSNTYTYLITIIYIHKKYSLIPNRHELKKRF